MSYEYELDNLRGGRLVLDVEKDVAFLNYILADEMRVLQAESSTFAFGGVLVGQFAAPAVQFRLVSFFHSRANIFDADHHCLFLKVMSYIKAYQLATR